MRRNKNIRPLEFPLRPSWKITPQMKEELLDLLKVTKYQTLGELVRDILDGKTIMATYYTAESDPLLEVLSTNRQLLEKMNEAIDVIFKRLYQQQPADINVEDINELISISLEAVEVMCLLFEPVEMISDRFGAGE